MTEATPVRPARAEDIAAVADILVEGFSSMFAAAFGERIDRASRTLARSLTLEVPRGLPGLYVAVVGGQVAGTVALRRREDPEAPAWPATGIFFQELGLWGGLRAMFYLSLLDQPFGRHEVYVADVAVAPAFRRRGVAQAMLRHAEHVARFWGKQALVLDVNAQNDPARRLYDGLGYTVEHVRHSLLTRWLLGQGDWVRMRRELPPLDLPAQPAYNSPA
jgi:ribosomal protein S18 acetylase RimI-like enzyme